MKKLNLDKVITIFFLIIILILRYLQIYSIIPNDKLGKYIIISFGLYLVSVIVMKVKQIKNKSN